MKGVLYFCVVMVSFYQFFFNSTQFVMLENLSIIFYLAFSEVKGLKQKYK